MGRLRRQTNKNNRRSACEPPIAVSLGVGGGAGAQGMLLLIFLFSGWKKSRDRPALIFLLHGPEVKKKERARGILCAGGGGGPFNVNFSTPFLQIFFFLSP